MIEGIEYLDGGFAANNPSSEMYNEVKIMNNNSDASVSVFLSIGSGKYTGSRLNRSNRRFRYSNYLNVAKKWAEESEDTHLFNSRALEGFQYYRLNVEEGLGDMKLDEWRIERWRSRARTLLRHLRSAQINDAEKPASPKPSNDFVRTLRTAHMDQSSNQTQPRNKTLGEIRKHTYKYLSKQEVQDWIREIAARLVEIRRQRARSDLQRWEKFCFSTWYQCNVRGCPRAQKEYRSRGTFESHLLDKHRDLFTREDRARLDEAVAACRKVVS